MTWTDYKTEFEWDESGRDLYIPATTVDDWQRLLDYLSTSQYDLEYSVEDEETPLPSDVRRIFGLKSDASGFLCVDVHGIPLNCHFFAETEIELDLDPRDVDTEGKLDELFEFMSEVGRLLEKPVLLTPENTHNKPLFRFDPQTQSIDHRPHA